MGSFWSHAAAFVVLHRRLFNADDDTCRSCQQTGPLEILHHIAREISQKREKQDANNEEPGNATIQNSILVSVDVWSSRVEMGEFKVENNSLQSAFSFQRHHYYSKAQSRYTLPNRLYTY